MGFPIRHLVSTFQAKDGTALTERRWLPEKIRAVVVLIHGFAEHSGCYDPHARRLCEEGISVEAIDLRGHGHSEGRRGYVYSFRTLVDDVKEFLDRVSARNSNSSTFLLGHSFGGAIAGLANLELQDSRLAGLILSSPAIQLCEPVWLQRTGLLLARLAPRLPTKRLDRRKLSSDMKYVEVAKRDPQNFHGLVLTQSAAQIILAGRELLKRASRLSLPLLIVHGTDDRITMPEASGSLYARSASIDKSLNLYRGMRHETLNEPNGRMVLDRITEFIVEQATDAAAP